jgi:hypothetical protein
MGRPKEERRSTGIELGSLSDKKSEPKALLDHQAFCVNSAAVKFDPQLMEEQRQSISYDALIDKLVREIGRLLGKDDNHLIDKITLHRVADQHPNCADIGAASPYDLNAFRQAVCWRFMSSSQASYLGLTSTTRNSGGRLATQSAMINGPGPFSGPSRIDIHKPNAISFSCLRCNGASGVTVADTVSARRRRGPV